MTLHQPALPSSELRLSPRLSLRARRWIVVVPSVVLAGAMIALEIAVLAGAPHPALDWLLLVPFALATSWESFILWQNVVGFSVWASGSRGLSDLEQRVRDLDPTPTGLSRTAILMPIFEEDPAAVFANVGIMLRSLDRAGGRGDVHVHVLSDTQSVAVLEREREEWAALQAQGVLGVSYSHRGDNAGRKAGNIQAFMDRAKNTYDFAIILDADSLMSGVAMRQLICLMEESPRIGLIQTVSFATGRDTLFARIQQFAVRLYAPLALRGLHFWQGHEGSYWGHNAILRIEPFRLHCRLPVLPGKPPLGGEILCHDIVEGALLVRSGWEVHLLPHLQGTWEEIPTNALDLVSRERRWCQGNLQHLRVLAFSGLRSASRAHLALGIGGYVMAPIWWTFLILGALRVLGGGTDNLGLLAFGVTETGIAASLLVLANVAFLLIPRGLNLTYALGDAHVRRSFGGAGRLLAGTAVEQLFWILFGPVLSFITLNFVTSILTGYATGWTGQSRADRQVSLAEAFSYHRLHMLVGALFGVVAVRAGGWYALWMTPVALGLLLSPILTLLSSRIDLGHWSRRVGLFFTTDDLNGHPELLELSKSRPEKFAA